MLIDRRRFLALASAALASAALASPALALEPASWGRVEILDGIRFDNLPRSRVRVWLPSDYENNASSHQVIYMLDGQYSFADDSDGINFAADRRIASLVATRTIRPTIIVAIDNLDNDRFLQYMPQTIYDQAKGDLRAGIDRELDRLGGRQLLSSQFINFLKRELKPFIDRNYRTLPGRLDTTIFGASVAGMMAGAIFVEAQDVFGRAGCMSPNWPIYDERFIDYQQLLSLWPDYFEQLGAPHGRRLWLDHGTEMMDAGMAPHQRNIAERLTALGWLRGCNLQTRVYQGAGHAFAQTAEQMDEMLAWLLA